MTDPIRPEDHEIPVPGWDGMRYGPMAHKLALTEAIHQTFERDAARVESPIPKQRQCDPDTEIDRLARLIVEGEYRRRGTNTQSREVVDRD
jgi:hypothetical protein